MGFSQISTAFLALCVALSLSACGGAAPTASGGEAKALTTVPSSTSEELKAGARKEGSLLWYSSKPTPTVSALAAAFEDEYGIRVETYKAGGSQVLAKVESELASGGLRADVVDYSDIGAAVSQAGRGVFAQYAPERSTMVPKELRSPEGFWTIYGPYSARIAYNPKLLTEQEAPKSWDELKDPKWRGKIGMASPDYAGAAVMTIHGWQKKFGKDFMNQIGPNLTVFQGFGDVQNALLSGQVPVAVVLSFRAFADEALGAPIKTVEPTEGEFLLGDAAAINADAKSPNAARLFMNFLLEKRAQDILSKAYMYPAAEDVKPQDGVPALEALKGIQPDAASLADPKVVLEVKNSFKSATGK